MPEKLFEDFPSPEEEHMKEESFEMAAQETVMEILGLAGKELNLEAVQDFIKKVKDTGGETESVLNSLFAEYVKAANNEVKAKEISSKYLKTAEAYL
jgi:hypothetical protein